MTEETPLLPMSTIEKGATLTRASLDISSGITNFLVPATTRSAIHARRRPCGDLRSGIEAIWNREDLFSAFGEDRPSARFSYGRCAKPALASCLAGPAFNRQRA